MAERISARFGLNTVALVMSLAAGAFFFPSLVCGLALPGFVLSLIGFKHSIGVRRAGSDVHAADDASERALHFGIASASLSGLLLAVALMSLVFLSRDYP